MNQRRPTAEDHHHRPDRSTPGGSTPAGSTPHDEQRTGRRRPTIAALRQAIGTPARPTTTTGPARRRPGGGSRSAAEVACEDGAERPVSPARLRRTSRWATTTCVADGAGRRLIVSPGRCWLPDRRAPGAGPRSCTPPRSSGSWGIGDLGDLRRAARVAAATGRRLRAGQPAARGRARRCRRRLAPTCRPPAASATRCTCASTDVPGAAAADLADLARRGGGSTAADLIDRDARLARSSATALQRIFGRPAPAPTPFAAWRGAAAAASCDRLRRLVRARRAARPDWHAWPAGLRRPDGRRRCAAFAAEHAGDRVAFHAWLQWLLDLQLRRGRRRAPLSSTTCRSASSGGGADAWAWQDGWPPGVTVGAPPDAFNTRGQDWGSPPLRAVAAARRRATSRSSQPIRAPSPAPAGCGSTT